MNKPRENHTENTHPTASTEWLTVMQVCDRAHIGRTYLYDAWATGTGPRYSQVGGKRLIKDTRLNDWLLAHEVPTDDHELGHRPNRQEQAQTSSGHHLH